MPTLEPGARTASAPIATEPATRPPPASVWFAARVRPPDTLVTSSVAPGATLTVPDEEIDDDGPITRDPAVTVVGPV